MEMEGLALIFLERDALDERIDRWLQGAFTGGTTIRGL
jgi:hypothetical protein